MEIDYREMRRLDAMHFDLTLMLSADIRLRILSLLSMTWSCWAHISQQHCCIWWRQKTFQYPRGTPSIHKKRCRIRGTFPIPNNTILNTCSTHHLFMVLEFNENVWMLLTAHRVYQSTEVKRLQVSFNFLLNCDYYLNCFRCNFSFNPNIFFLLCSFDKIIWMSFHSLLTSWNLIGVETVNVLYSVCAGVCVYALLWGRAAKWDLCASTQCHFCC